MQVATAAAEGACLVVGPARRPPAGRQAAHPRAAVIGGELPAAPTARRPPEITKIEIRLGGNRLRSMAHAGSASGYCQAGKPFMCIEANLSFISIREHTRLAERWVGKACRRGKSSLALAEGVCELRCAATQSPSAAEPKNGQARPCCMTDEK